jgi:hypothetical protein
MSLVEETLTVWREAERLLKSMPPLEPDHESVRKLVIELRDMYAALSRGRHESAETVARSRELIDRARNQMRLVRLP